jgi:hypothetical protein
MPKDVICFGKCRHMTPRLIANVARVLHPTWFSTLPEPHQKSRNRAGSVSDLVWQILYSFSATLIGKSLLAATLNAPYRAAPAEG